MLSLVLLGRGTWSLILREEGLRMPENRMSRRTLRMSENTMPRRTLRMCEGEHKDV
jgi:hypothetical protein